MIISQRAAIASHTNELIDCVTSNMKHIVCTHACCNICIYTVCSVSLLCVRNFVYIDKSSCSHMCNPVVCCFSFYHFFMLWSVSLFLSYSFSQTHTHTFFSSCLSCFTLHIPRCNNVWFNFLGLFSFWFSIHKVSKENSVGFRFVFASVL